jgi:hypothetical protein
MTHTGRVKPDRLLRKMRTPGIASRARSGSTTASCGYSAGVLLLLQEYGK